MITPQQRNAWRGAYLRQLRKIAQAPLPNDWVRSTEWDNALEAHLALFTFCDSVRIFKVLEHILRNHPVEVAEIDESENPDDLPTCQDLYSFLITLGNYGLNNIFSHLNCPEETKQSLWEAVLNRDEGGFEDVFVKIKQENEDVLTKIGYSLNLLTVFNKLIEYLDDIEEDYESEESLKNSINEFGKRFDPEMLAFFAPSDDFLSAVKYLSVFEIEHLSEDFQSMYCYQVKTWMAILTLLEEDCSDKEIAIINALLAKAESQELISDFERLAYLLFDYVPKRLYTPKSFNLSELDVLKQELNA